MGVLVSYQPFHSLSHRRVNPGQHESTHRIQGDRGHGRGSYAGIWVNQTWHIPGSPRICPVSLYTRPLAWYVHTYQGNHSLGNMNLLIESKVTEAMERLVYSGI